MSDSESTNDDELIDEGRRRVLTSAAAVAGAGALGVYVGSERAVAAPQGTYPVATDPALLKIRADRIRLVERTSDPSSPDDGEIWYNGSA
jgi:hypothetical protein